jgi:hypothetical protein
MCNAARLLKQPVSNKETRHIDGAPIFSDLPSSTDDYANNTFELNTTNALKPAEYIKVDLEEQAQAHQ